MPALAFPEEHPFHHSLIGSMSDLDAASLEDIATFFSTYYTPDNAVLSIAGDFDPIDVRVMVERHFGGIPRGSSKPPLPDMTLPPTLGGALRQVVPDDVMLPRLFIAFRSPVLGTDEYFAASVTSAVLGLRKGSRLHRVLVREQQIAAEAAAFTYDLSKGSDLLVVDVMARPETSADALEAAVHAELDRLVAEGVTPAEVARAIALIETELAVALQSAGDRADRLSMFATYFGDPGLVNVQAERYRAVTEERVNTYIRKHLVTDNRASLLYVPREAAYVPIQDDLAMAEAP